MPTTYPIPAPNCPAWCEIQPHGWQSDGGDTNKVCRVSGPWGEVTRFATIHGGGVAVEEPNFYTSATNHASDYGCAHDFAELVASVTGAVALTGAP